MVKMLKLPSIFRSRNTEASCKWLPFKHFKSIPFQADSIVSPSNAVTVLSMLDSSFSQSKCLSATLIESGGEVVEMAAKALRSRRFFYEPANSSLSVRASGFSFQDCVVQAIESNNPYMDIRKSMEEMVEAYGLKAKKIDWDYLEELLAWYLRMNRKKNHGFIIEAFIDVLAGPSSGSSYCSFCYDASASSSKSYLKPRIIPEPELRFLPRTKDDECLILASDGLWDVMTNEEVRELARKRTLLLYKMNGITLPSIRGEGIDPSTQAPAELLLNRAIQKGSKDNITVIVVDLKAQRKFESKTRWGLQCEEPMVF